MKLLLVPIPSTCPGPRQHIAGITQGLGFSDHPAPAKHAADYLLHAGTQRREPSGCYFVPDSCSLVTVGPCSTPGSLVRCSPGTKSEEFTVLGFLAPSRVFLIRVVYVQPAITAVIGGATTKRPTAGMGQKPQFECHEVLKCHSAILSFCGVSQNRTQNHRPPACLTIKEYAGRFDPVINDLPKHIRVSCKAALYQRLRL